MPGKLRAAKVFCNTRTNNSNYYRTATDESTMHYQLVNDNFKQLSQIAITRIVSSIHTIHGISSATDFTWANTNCTTPYSDNVKRRTLARNKQFSVMQTQTQNKKPLTAQHYVGTLMLSRHRQEIKFSKLVPMRRKVYFSFRCYNVDAILR